MERRNARTILVEKPYEKLPPGRLIEDNNKLTQFLGKWA
jgi:hypothetical protein